MPVIEGKGPSWLEDGQTLVASGKKPETPSEKNSVELLVASGKKPETPSEKNSVEPSAEAVPETAQEPASPPPKLI